MDDQSMDDAPASTEPAPLLMPSGGVPPVQTSGTEFDRTAELLREGDGPVALDTERASGFRFSNRAYLVQIRRQGSGTYLIDPIREPDRITAIADALDGPQWVLHAADQDLPSLQELGFRCADLFDTELAGRLLNLPKVNLAAMVARFLDRGLAKGHGAADWSTRPLPREWLIYAALDVEMLIELRDAVARALTEAGKMSWATEEFDYIRTRPVPPPRADRWRRTSGVHGIRDRRRLAAVKELWEARESTARTLDVAPGRVLPDAAIIAAATALPMTVGDLTRLPVFGGSRQRRRAGTWFAAVERARRLDDSALPTLRQTRSGPPAANRWTKIKPEAAQRLSCARTAMAALAEAHDLPVENILQPDLLRALCWDDLSITEYTIDERLRTGRARRWQRSLCVPALTEALSQCDT